MFNTVDEVTHWDSFTYGGVTYDFSHLDAHEVSYCDDKIPDSPVVYKFIITYSFHCFARKIPDGTDVANAPIYSSPKEKRLFCGERYELSKSLPGIINAITEPHVYVCHAGHSRYAAVEIDVGGVLKKYFIAFKVFREKKRLRLHVESAYPKHPIGKSKKVKFFTIAFNLRNGKKLPGP